MKKDTILLNLNNHKPEILKFGVIKIGLFGSYLRNEQNEKSDIDLLVQFRPEKKNFYNLTGLLIYLEDLFPGIKIDLVPEENLKPALKKYILGNIEYA